MAIPAEQKSIISIKMGAENAEINENQFKIRPPQQMIAACSGAFVTAITMTPFDVVKTRLQTQQKTQISNKCFLYCNGLMDHICPCPYSANGNGNGTPTQPYKGTIDAIIKISRNEGILSLWSGLTPTLALAVPATVLYFVVYDELRQRFTRQYLLRVPNSESSSSLVPPLLAGITARTLSATLINPLELIRTKLQSEKLSYLDLTKALKSMVAREGIAGLWKGVGPTLWRDVPFSGIYWSVYETYKKRYAHYTDSKNPSFGFCFVGGGIAGSVAALVTTPFDVIKTQKQIAFGEKFLYPESATRPDVNTLQMARQIYSTNGLKGLFAGITPRLMKIAPACAIMIASFEYGKSFFLNYNKNVYYSDSSNEHHHRNSKQTLNNLLAT